MDTRVLLVDDDEVIRKLIESILTKQGFSVTLAEDGPVALTALASARFDILLLDVMMPGMDGFTVCRQVRANPATRHIPVVMLTALDSVENKVKGFEVGADDYIAKPCDALELVARMNALLRRMEGPPEASLDSEPARTIAVFSLRGGSGVTTISVNLAAGLAQLWGMHVALVDMVAVAGQSALFLNQSLRNTWADLCKIPTDEIDPDVVLSAMLAHQSRFQTLASPPRLEQGDLLSGEKTNKVLDHLSASYPYVVLDMPHNLSESSLAALDHSDVILHIVQPEIVSLRAASLALDTFEAIHYTDKKIYTILNWTFPRQGLALKDIERLIKTRIDLVLPYAADEFIPALNLGNPPVLQNPESPLGAIFEDMAMSLSKDEHRAKQSPQPTPAWKRVTERSRKRKQAQAG